MEVHRNQGLTVREVQRSNIEKSRMKIQEGTFQFEQARRHGILRILPGMLGVPVWLKSLRLHKYTPLFMQLSYEEMLALTEEKLEAEGVTKGARRKIVNCVQNLTDRVDQLKRLEKDVIEQASLRATLADLKRMAVTPMRPFPLPGRPETDQALIDGIDVTVEDLDDENLPAHLTRVVEKLCTQMCANGGQGQEYGNFVTILHILDQCIEHEAFTQAQTKLLAKKKQIVKRVWISSSRCNRPPVITSPSASESSAGSMASSRCNGRGRVTKTHLDSCSSTSSVEKEVKEVNKEFDKLLSSPPTFAPFMGEFMRNMQLKAAAMLEMMEMMGSQVYQAPPKEDANFSNWCGSEEISSAQQARPMPPTSATAAPATSFVPVPYGMPPMNFAVPPPPLPVVPAQPMLPMYPAAQLAPTVLPPLPVTSAYPMMSGEAQIGSPFGPIGSRISSSDGNGSWGSSLVTPPSSGSSSTGEDRWSDDMFRKPQPPSFRSSSSARSSQSSSSALRSTMSSYSIPSVGLSSDEEFEPPHASTPLFGSQTSVSSALGTEVVRSSGDPFSFVKPARGGSDKCSPAPPKSQPLDILIGDLSDLRMSDAGQSSPTSSGVSSSGSFPESVPNMNAFRSDSMEAFRFDSGFMDACLSPSSKIDAKVLGSGLRAGIASSWQKPSDPLSLTPRERELGLQMFFSRVDDPFYGL